MSSASPLPILLTANAHKRVWNLLIQEEDTSLMLRAYITGGGCHGFQYGFSFEEQAKEDDTRIQSKAASVVEKELLARMVANSKPDQTHEGDLKEQTKVDKEEAKQETEEEEEGGGMGDITLLVDPISLQYLQGAEIDFVHDAQGERFVINNPNAKVTCGCARSFAA